MTKILVTKRISTDENNFEGLVNWCGVETRSEVWMCCELFEG